MSAPPTLEQTCDTVTPYLLPTNKPLDSPVYTSGHYRAPRCPCAARSSLCASRCCQPGECCSWESREFSSIWAVPHWSRTFPYWRSKSADNKCSVGCGVLVVGIERTDRYSDLVRTGVGRSGRHTSRWATSSLPSTAG